jgi:hypothetical protein
VRVAVYKKMNGERYSMIGLHWEESGVIKIGHALRSLFNSLFQFNRNSFSPK